MNPSYNKTSHFTVSIVNEWINACTGSTLLLIIMPHVRFDINQGELGDCWVLASLASLTLHPSLLEHLVPPGQTFIHNYSGIFHFRLYVLGYGYYCIFLMFLPAICGLIRLRHRLADQHGGMVSLKTWGWN